MKTITITQLAKDHNTTIKDVKDKLIRVGILQADRKTLTTYAVDNHLAEVQRLPKKGKFYSTIVYDMYEIEMLLADEFIIDFKN